MNAEKRKKAVEFEDEIALETAFYEGIVRRDPNYLQALELLGECYSRQGKWSKALKVDQRMSELCPDAPLIQYNLACSFASLNKLPQALVALKRSIDLGFDDFGWLSQDPDLANLRSWLESTSPDHEEVLSKKSMPLKGLE
jgi:tetratricopeptide (TPR) repeat protein